MRPLLLVLLALPLVATAQVKLFLRDGSFNNGVIRTDKGGVIEDEKIRIQAQNLLYQRASGSEMVQASGNLLVLFDKRLLSGKNFTYDFATREGTIEEPVIASDGWVLTGQKLLLQADGSLIIENGEVAPPSNIDMTVGFDRIRLQRSSHIHARRLSIRFFKQELLCWSQMRTSLDALTDIPIQFRLSFGGYESLRAGIRYKLIQTDEFRAYLRLDAIPSRGIGGGLDTNYCSNDRKRFIDTKSFLIHDRSWDDPDTRWRYRLQGVGQERHEKLFVRACYDWLSDSEMASNYRGKDFELPTAQRTELFASYREVNWLADFTARVNINDSFQTINEELPGFQISWRPFALGSSGILFENRLRAAYLNYVYANGTPNSPNFGSGRIELQSRLYRLLTLGPLLITPEAGVDLIHYSNSPSKHSQEQAVAILATSVSAPLYHNSFYCLHTLEPYSSYTFYSKPTAPFGKPFIFTIDDGFGTLNMWRIGARQSFFLKRGPSLFIRKPLFMDLWTLAFINAPALEKSVPRIYGALSWNPFPTLETKVEAAWNRENNAVDYVNPAAAWTINADLAVKVAFYKRGSFCWRKANPDNFMLDVIQPEIELLNSIVSDRRNTVITNIFWRFHPDYTAQFQTHTGWNRTIEPAYNEYKFTLSTILFSNWRLTVNLERREVEFRYSFALKLIR